MSHSHGGHGGGCCSHSGDENDGELGVQYSLYMKINLDEVQCLNELVEDSGKLVFKPWDKRLDTGEFVQSDVDEELLFNIPFTGNVKLKGLALIGGEGDTHPAKMRLYKNRPHMAFDDVNCEPEEHFEIPPHSSGVLEYSLKAVKFSSCYHLTIYFPKNFGADSTKVYYIGLQGEFISAFRQEITLCSYESAPNPAEHKLKSMQRLPQEIH